MHTTVTNALLFVALAALIFMPLLLGSCTSAPDYFERYGMDADAERARYANLNSFSNYSPADRYRAGQPYESDGAGDRDATNFGH